MYCHLHNLTSGFSTPYSKVADRLKYLATISPKDEQKWHTPCQIANNGFTITYETQNTYPAKPVYKPEPLLVLHIILMEVRKFMQMCTHKATGCSTASTAMAMLVFHLNYAHIFYCTCAVTCAV